MGSRVIIEALEDYLRSTEIRRVHFADGSTVPPVLAYVTNFPRLTIPLAGQHAMQIAHRGRTINVKTTRGHAVFVPDHAWNKPDWEGRLDVLTFLFGTKQIGVSLVRHGHGSSNAVSATKANVHGYDPLTHHLLAALMAAAADREDGALARMLTESLLRACLRVLRSSRPQSARKAVRTYESVCLYVQENFREAITRESVAQHFGISPNHVSRLFRKEGFMSFNDYLNLVRLNRAKFMLQNYTLTLKEIACNCGYSDVAYFCRVFKKTMNVTPTSYRAGILACA